MFLKDFCYQMFTILIDPVASPISRPQQDISHKSKNNNSNTHHNYNQIQLFLQNRSQPLISVESSV